MRIETVIPCVGYDDFLTYTLPRNLRELESVTILTAPWDEQTIGIAKQFKTGLLATEAWRIGGLFNKARALNEWIKSIGDISGDTWLLTLDADIILPYGRKIPVEKLERSGLYSAPRHMCHDRASLQKFVRNEAALESFPIMLPPIRNGLAWGIYPTSNVAGLSGYMQLWCPAYAPGMREFPESGTAAGYDVKFALSFPEGKRRFIPEFGVLHLGPAEMNWTGRRSQRWSL